MIRRFHREAGVTLIEMMMVVALISLMAAIMFPSVTSGLDTVRLTSATDSIVSFVNAGLNRAERRQMPVEIVISIPENALKLFSVDLSRELTMPETIRIIKIHPESFNTEEQTRSVVLYPNGAVPRFGVEIQSPQGSRRIVRVDPVTGVAQVEVPQQPSL